MGIRHAQGAVAVGDLSTKECDGWMWMNLWSLYPGIFLDMFKFLVEMWPQFPLQEHLVPQGGPLDLASGLCFG